MYISNANAIPKSFKVLDTFAMCGRAVWRVVVAVVHAPGV